MVEKVHLGEVRIREKTTSGFDVTICVLVVWLLGSPATAAWCGNFPHGQSG